MLAPSTGLRIQAAIELHLVIGELFIGLFNGMFHEEDVGGILRSWDVLVEA